ncbi:RagB/SusD family nutrient uptake outer membrane protein [Myroides pelagicus]|uniref:RagB/SusD family nutrient uptake outer membrane protein n=1 Tax=Myroides pelagicus TaxID=270914 RepID=A0A7K1GKS5_9FLAO|nr:RagB/SusD family nutrient uptake outer membrane protein [Myroides pelagicus]MEC4113718.1 RagB/SusD family nutrient uptake outer membrane protein [Myroides pelagicus]MTH28824.1 RagB/SusD family nutrient uptake outer membrane protein [Myroides pelagicus]
MKKIIFSILSMVLLSGGLASCSDDRLDATLDSGRDNTERPIESERDLRAVLTGAYSRMVQYNYYGRDIIIFGEVRSDNAYAEAGFSNRFQIVSQFNMNANTIYPSDSWEQILRVVSSANLAISSNVTIGDPVNINHSKGEAYAVRALAHFDLLRLFGEQNVKGRALDGRGVPYMLNFADLDKNNYARKTVGEVRDLIYADLVSALELMNDGEQNKKRLTREAVLGLKSRIALFFSAYDQNDLQIAKEAAEQAMAVGFSSVVSRGGYVDSFKAEEPQVNTVFELYQDNVVNAGNNSINNIYSYEGYGDVVGLEANLVALFDDAKDIRSSAKMQGYKYIRSKDGEYKFVNNQYVLIAEGEEVEASKRYTTEYYRNFGKYTSRSSNVKVMRFEEIVFNYIEAAIALSPNDAKAITLFNELMAERYEGYAPVSTLSLEQVLVERRKEFVFEGLRFDDMMRHKMDVPETPMVKDGVAFGSYKLAFPIPQNEINDSQIEQNDVN